MGGKRITIEFVKEQFEKKGYELTSKEYVNSQSKLDYICPEGHKTSICWGNFQRGQGCWYCRNEKQSEARKGKNNPMYKGGPEASRIRRNKKLKNKYQEDSNYRLSSNISKHICQALKGNKAGWHWEDLVNYSLEDLKQRLESQFKEGMCWENYGTWHIDHCIPHSWFPDNMLLEAWSLWNLQPMWGTENKSKCNHYKSTIKFICKGAAVHGSR